MAYLPRIAFALIVLASAQASALDCPTLADGTVAPNWPTNKSPDVNYNGGAYVQMLGIACGGRSPRSPPNPSYVSSFAAAVAAWDARSCPGGPCLDAYPFVHTGNFTGFTEYCRERSDVSGWYGEGIRVYTTDNTCTIPEPPPACEAGNSYAVSAIAASEADAITAFTGKCHNGCQVNASSINDHWLKSGSSPGDYWGLLKLTETGTACDGQGLPIPPTETPPPETPVAEETLDGENCITSSAGVEYCDSDAYGENCGYVNDNFVCLGKTDGGECWINPDGSRLCAEGAPMPPVPDSGVPGTPATPDDQVRHTNSNGVTNNYNYYNTTTVAGSSRDPGDSGADPNNPASTDPRTESSPVTEQGSGGTGEGEGTGASASGGASCEDPPVCDGDPVGCALLSQQWRTRCTDITAEDALAAMGATPEEIAGDLGVAQVDVSTIDADGGFTASACPAPVSISIMGQSLSLDIWQRGCDMALLFAPFVLAMGYFAGAMLFIKGGV